MTDDPGLLALLADHGTRPQYTDLGAGDELRICHACLNPVIVAADLDGRSHRIVNITDPTTTLLEPAATGWKITQTRLAVITTCPGPP